MKFLLSIVLVLSHLTVEIIAKPVETVGNDTPEDDGVFHKMIDELVAGEKMEDLCSLKKNLHNILKQSKDESDQKVIKNGFDYLNNATQKLDNFHCQSVIATLVTTTTENPTTTMMS